jgi:sugar/nucleoside kinase (ribokinase family)
MVTSGVHLSIQAAGCGLVDYLHTPVDFASAPFRRFTSRRDGDGGLRPGRLVFAEELERFAGVPFAALLFELTGGRPPQRTNLGGPAVVAAINAAQLLCGQDVEVGFHGARGNDRTGRDLEEFLGRTTLDCSGCRVLPGATPFTYVFSDPTFAGDRGERMFVNAIAAAGSFEPELLAGSYFAADVALLGGTGIVPPLHRRLGSILRSVRGRGGITVADTGFDFLNEQADPVGPWPVGEDAQTWRSVDVVIADEVEALRMSGCASASEALRFFAEMGAGAAVVTRGAEPFVAWSSGRDFAAMGPEEMPVCAAVDRDLRDRPQSRGDTTGCGDNFVGGIVASLAEQLARGGRRGSLDLVEACAWGAASGGFACFYVGGTWFESRAGEKRDLVAPYTRGYLAQLGRPAQG